MTTVYLSGLIGKADLALNTDTSLGTLGLGMTVNILVTSRIDATCKIRIAISNSAIAPDPLDYIDYDKELFGKTSRERGGIAASAGETIWVRTDTIGVSARAHGVLLP